MHRPNVASPSGSSDYAASDLCMPRVNGSQSVIDVTAVSHYY